MKNLQPDEIRKLVQQAYGQIAMAGEIESLPVEDESVDVIISKLGASVEPTVSTISSRCCRKQASGKSGSRLPRRRAARERKQVIP